MSKFMIVGMAKSGQAAAARLLKQGHTVYLSDKRTAEAFNGQLSSLESNKTVFCLGETPDEHIEEVDTIVISPGVPIQSPFIQKARDMGKEVIGEIELAWRLNNAEVIGITGTNGKTTTTALTGEIMAASGRKTFVVGNIGTPYISVEEAENGDVFVAEISSFQLESTASFRAHTAAILNITEDHLNRHGTMREYMNMKERIFLNQTEEDFAVLNADDELLSKEEIITPAAKYYFSRKSEVERGCFLDAEGWIVWRDGADERVIHTDDIGIIGPHNTENAMAAIAMAKLNGVATSVVRDAVHNFKAVEHRLEYVTTVDGVDFINDSKGTNPDATVKAVQSMKKPTVLIAGGSKKESDYVPVIQAFGDNIKSMVLIGQTADEIAEAARKCGYESFSFEKTFEEAINSAFAQAREWGGTVLLSPACASFDMFENYERRGEIFKEIVWRIKERNERTRD